MKTPSILLDDIFKRATNILTPPHKYLFSSAWIRVKSLWRNGYFAVAFRKSVTNSKQTHNQVSALSNAYAVLDFETTGLNPNRGDRAIEIGISLVDNGVEIDTFSSLINPGMPVDPFITSLTGISNRMLSSAPSASDVIPDVLEFVGDAHLVAHNACFDRKFWRHEIKQTRDIADAREFLCTLMLSRRIFQSFSSHRLAEIALSLGIEAKNSHRALADAQVTARAFVVMLERLCLAYPEDTVDGKFLRTYQRKSRGSLPDLTTEQQSYDAAKNTRSKRHVTIARLLSN